MKKRGKAIIAFIVAVCMMVVLMPTATFGQTNYKVRALQIWGGASAGASNYNTYESEHFQVIYGNTTYNNIVINSEYLIKVTNYLEQAWDVFVNGLNMKEPVTSVNSSYDQTTPYKVNVVVMGTGITDYDYGWAFASIDAHGYPYLMCGPDALTYETVLAHEFGHVMHYAQGNNSWVDNIYLGPWWEGIANWFAEQYRYEYLPGTTEMSSLYLRANALTQMNGRAYYQAWPFLQYLHENPEGYEYYGEDFIQKLLEYKPKNTSVNFYEVLDACNGNVSVQDSVGAFASHMATLDFKEKEAYNAQINKETDVILYWPQRYTVLEPLGDEENTYAVPVERAPEAMGYNIIPLKFTPGTVSVTINPLTDIEAAAWRGRLVVESEDGVTSYSQLFAEGETMSMEVGENDELYLSVAATPSIDSMVKHTIGGWASHSYESNLPYEDKPQYPYSVTMEGAEPMTERPVPAGYYRRHSNGGGLVSYYARVADTAYVGPNAVVMGNATVSDNAIIDGYATVNHGAKVTDNAYIGDYAVLYDRAVVSDNARVIENACLYVDYKVSGSAVVKGQAHALGAGSATDEAILYGDWYEDGGKNVSSGSYSGYLSIAQDSSYAPVTLENYYVRPYVVNLRSEYEFNGNMKDDVAATHLYGVNSPELDDECITFNGSNYVDLNASVLYYDSVTIALKAKGEGEVINLGNGDIVLSIASDATLKVGEEEVSINDVGTYGWNEFEIKFSEGTVTLKVNDASKSKQVSISPLDAVRNGKSYVGKNFEGSVDYLRIYDNSYQYKGKMGSLTDDYYAVMDMSGSVETGTLSSAGAKENSLWKNWSCTSGNVVVDGGLTVRGNTTATINAPKVKTDRFVIEFKPSGGKAYPDHGVIDIDGEVLFGYRVATDASVIYTGRGETNAAIRTGNSVTDTSGQTRLSNFAAEKLYGATTRNDRGGLSFTDYAVRIVAENHVWNDELAQQFALAENKTSVLDGLKDGDAVYIVTYSLLNGGLEMPASVNVYKGSFEGFGGFKVAGGTSNVNVTYEDLRVYAENPVRLEVVGKAVVITGLTDSAVAIFAIYEDGMLVNTTMKNVSSEGIVDIPEGFEESTVYLFTKANELVPLAKAYKIVE